MKEDILTIINNILEEVDMDSDQKELLEKHLQMAVLDKIDLSTLKTKLEILYNYEKNYLMLIKEFKEEIKFAGALQEDLRKERAKFFSETLKEVSNTLKEAQVDDEVAGLWLKELVSSYTKSLDVSTRLAEEHTLDMVGKIRSEAKQQIKDADINN